MSERVCMSCEEAFFHRPDCASGYEGRIDFNVTSSIMREIPAIPASDPPSDADWRKRSVAAASAIIASGANRAWSRQYITGLYVEDIILRFDAELASTQRALDEANREIKRLRIELNNQITL